MINRRKLISKYKNYILLTTTIVASLVLFLQNIEYLFDKSKNITHSLIDDLIVVDYFFSGDTLDIRLINHGNKTVGLTEAKILVDSTWRIYESTLEPHFYFRWLPTNKYDINLPDSSKSYEVKHKIFQALKPNDVDRFQLILGGGKCIHKVDTNDINYELIIEELGPVDYYSESCAYFILFRLQLMLNEGNDYLELNPMIHALGLNYYDTTNTSRNISLEWFDFIQKADIERYSTHNLYEYERNHYYSNQKRAINVSRMPYYKSETAKLFIEEILTH